MNRNYVFTITLYSRIHAADTPERKDRWVRTVLHNCFWKSQIQTSFNGTAASAQNTYVVRIPKNQWYLPYAEFVRKQEGHFSVSQGDLVILGECKEEISADNPAAKLLSKYKPNAFQVTAFSDNTAFPAAKHYRLGG